MAYHQITGGERYTLAALHQQGLTAAAIARHLSCHSCTIGREIRRNRTRHDGGYRPQLADWYARGRPSRSRRNARFWAVAWALVDGGLREDWSPEQVAGRLRRTAPWPSATSRSIGTSGRTSAPAASCMSMHHAWERGTNENTNGLLRQYLPKRQSMAHLTQPDCDRIAATLNRRPRKRLAYRTSE